MFKHRLPRAVLTTTALLAAATAHPAYSANPAATMPTAFAVNVTGTGAPVILIPGLASSGAVWDGTVQRSCAQRQCHVLTLAGFAGTPAIDAPLLPAVEQQLSDYIAAKQLAKPILRGHSMDGFPRIAAPTLVLGTRAAYQAFLPRSAVEALYRSQYQGLPGVQVALADTARHFVMYDDPEWMYARIDQFLK